MPDYKLSCYNFTFTYPNPTSAGEKQTVLYNSRTGSIALIEEDKYQQYLAFAEEGVPFPDEELVENLKLGGFLLDSDYDELAAIKLKLLSSRYAANALALIIAPTSDCNFRCIYCYEKDNIKPVTMSTETQEDLLNFIKGRLPYISSFHVTWYGGEPLIAIQIIEQLSKAFLELCEENRVDYSASMVTNGYLLTPEIAQKIRALKINSIQITLDGAAEDHDKRRFLKGGLPTFDRIVKNLFEAKDFLPESVAIRINADRHNIDRVDNVIRVLRENGLEEKVFPYLAMIENKNDTYNDNSCMHTNEFSMCQFDFIQRNGLDMISNTPKQIGSFCSADTFGSYVVNADGCLYKCWDDIGIKSRSIGTLKDGVKDCPQAYTYIMYDATEDAECRACKFLPICMGGCPNSRIYTPDNRCTPMKQGLISYMSVIPELIEKDIEREKQR